MELFYSTRHFSIMICASQRVGNLSIQAFVSQPVFEAYTVAVLPGTSRLDVQRPHAQLRQPRPSCGIYHSEEKLYLLVACKRRMEKVKSAGPREYLELLTGSGYRDVETRELLNEITIGETCVFRSQPQLNALHNVILPEIVAERLKIGLQKLKIWSAGCSTGEEP